VLFVVIFFLFGCANKPETVQKISNIEQLTSLLANNVSVETYDVSVFHNYGKHIYSINNLSLKIQNEKIIYLNGYFYQGRGTGKYYTDRCDIIYDPINYIKDINCTVSDGYDERVNVSDIEMKLNNIYSSIMNEFDNGNYSLSATYSLALVIISDRKKSVLKTLNENIEYHNLTDSHIIKSGDCFYWNITYGGFSEYNACFNNDLINNYTVKSSSLGYIDNQDWKIIIN
jgi:hypothetical protein